MTTNLSDYIQRLRVALEEARFIASAEGHGPCRSGGLGPEGVCANSCLCEWATELNKVIAPVLEEPLPQQAPNNLEQFAREWIVANKPEPPKRPTIAELQAILDSAETDQNVEINPDGSVGVAVPEAKVQMLMAFGKALLAEPVPLALHDAQVLRKAADAYEGDARQAGERPLFAARWLRARADTLEAEARKGAAPDEPGR